MKDKIKSKKQILSESILEHGLADSTDGETCLTYNQAYAAMEAYAQQFKHPSPSAGQETENNELMLAMDQCKEYSPELYVNGEYPKRPFPEEYNRTLSAWIRGYRYIKSALPAQQEVSKGMSDWISVREDWPKERETVLMYRQTGEFIFGYYANQQWQDRSSYYSNITHWKPLQSPQKEDES